MALKDQYGQKKVVWFIEKIENIGHYKTSGEVLKLKKFPGAALLLFTFSPNLKIGGVVVAYTL